MEKVILDAINHIKILVKENSPKIPFFKELIKFLQQILTLKLLDQNLKK